MSATSDLSQPAPAYLGKNCLLLVSFYVCQKPCLSDDPVNLTKKLSVHD